MASDTIAAVLFALSAINLGVSVSILLYAHRPVIKNSSMLTRISSQMETNGLTECSHCHHVVARYFIDGAGRPTCANCKPDGFLAAKKEQTLNVR